MVHRRVAAAHRERTRGFMDIFSGWHLLILLLVVVLVFGTGKISKLGPDLGKAVRGFKKALNGDSEDDKPHAATTEKLQADPPAAKAADAAKQPDSAESK